jgi:hypothetical protein
VATLYVTVAGLIPKELVSYLPPKGHEEIGSLLSMVCSDKENTIQTHSRNDALSYSLKSLCEASSKKFKTYHFESYFSSHDLDSAITELKGFLYELSFSPSIAVEATKLKYQESMEISLNGFDKNIKAKVSQPKFKSIKNGWAYIYDEEEIRKLILAAPISVNPKPDFDDDGESIQYAFGVLKSHLFLLEQARSLGMGFLYIRVDRLFEETEMNGGM